MKPASFIQRPFFFGPVALLLLAGLAGFALSSALENPDYDAIAREEIIGDTIQKGAISHSFWNFHTMLDRTVVGLGSLIANKPYFRNGVQTRGFREHLDSVEIDYMEDLKEGMHELRARTLEGTMHPAYRVHRWVSPTAPTFIYNHGASQTPYDGVFNAIFDLKKMARPPRANLIIIRTPFHRKGRFELNEGASTLSRFLAIMAVSVKLTEKLVQSAKRKGSRNVVVGGISLGGFVANRHHLAYNSAGHYIPVIAGTAFGEVYLGPSKAAPAALRHPEILRRHLNFTAEWRKANNNNVFPILGRFDNICRLEQQGPSYGSMPVEIWDRGHITTALSFRALRHVFLRRLQSGEK